MTLAFLLGNLVAAFFLPPLGLLLLAVIGFLLLNRANHFGKLLLGFSLGLLWLLSTPLVSGYLLDSLMPAPRVLTGKEADAIVILAGGSVPDAAEYGSDSLKWMTLERVRYGAWLARRLHKPILVTGGSTRGYGATEASLMAVTLEHEFGVKVRWTEENSRTTLENAQYSVPILKRAGIKRIYLVSHAWHLARAIPEFERLGMVVVPAGTGYHSGKFELGSLLPSASGMESSYFACHEALGLQWYRLLHHLKKS
jgi:uncharacterized SAM-binding protein YcdF (DUF218 family)